jgi:hypothetical protein
VLWLPSEAVSILALAALVLLPGVLVVRAPWTAVPALSLAFWVLTLWWLPFPAVSRARFVGMALAAFTLLAFIRVLPKHEVRPGAGEPGGESPSGGRDEQRASLDVDSRPAAPPLVSGPSLVVLAASLALLVPFRLWRHAPGPQMAFQTTAARLLVWRDGLPLSGEPLLPLASFGAHAPALPTLAADVSHLSGIEPAPAVLLVTLATVGLLLTGLFALYATMAKPWAAALSALLGLALAPWPGSLATWGADGALVGLSLGVTGAALLVGHSSRSSAVAAGLLLGSSALGQPLLAAVITGIAVVAVLWRPVARVALGTNAPERRAAAGRRLVLALGVALALAAPYLVRLGHDLSAREATAALTSPTPRDLRALALGAILLASAFAFASWLVPLRAREGGLARLRPREGGLAPLRPREGGLAVLALVAVSAVLLVVRVDAWIARGQLRAQTQAAIVRAGAATGALDAVCAPEGARDWIPALAGRQAGEPGPWIPPAYRDEWAARARRPCVVRLEVFVDGR